MADFEHVQDFEAPIIHPQPDPGTATLAVITGASSGIGLELARIAASRGHDLVLVARHLGTAFAGREALEQQGRTVVTVEADLSTRDGVDRLMDAIGDRPVAILCANAGEGLGDGFLEQDFDRVRHMIDTNITGTIDLVQRVATQMRAEGFGRILFTGSIAGVAPGPFQAAYGASKAFINSFAQALREELMGSGVVVTVLMPGATDTRFFERAGMLDTKVGAGAKDDPRDVAEAGWKALMSGDDHVVAGAKNKAEALVSNILPEPLKARRFRSMSEPGSAERSSPMLPLLLAGGLAAGALALATRWSSGVRRRA
jgi:short-subunit dehydrogenase